MANTKTTEKKQSAKQKKILVASILLAATITAGSTFAWFTSKDEVTNRLSASANYGVTIAEDFTPPENLIPGQKVNKDVSVVNTGNIDSLVRVHLEGAMNVLKENAVANEKTVISSFPGTLTGVDDTDLIALGLTKKDDAGNFYRTLSTTERTNPNLGGNEENNNTDDNNYSEVKTVQAGGYLAYASGKFEFTPENAGYTYVGIDNKTYTQVTADKLSSENIKNTWSNGKGLAIDSDTFVPTSSGLFIFRRNITLSNNSGAEQDYEFSGYYADVDSTNNKVTYYALHYLPNEKNSSGNLTYSSDYVIYSTAQAAETEGNVLSIVYETNDDKTTPIRSVTPTTVKAYSAAYTRVDSLAGTYAANATDNTGTVTFTYPSANTTADNTIEVVANVVNIGGTGSENWTALTESKDPKYTYFYYNNDVEEGDSTAKLVDSVELDEDTRKSAYLALDFDLNIILDSVQVTVDESGNEDIIAAKSEWSQISNDNTKRNDGTAEIESITWTATNTP